MVYNEPKLIFLLLSTAFKKIDYLRLTRTVMIPTGLASIRSQMILLLKYSTGSH